MKKFLSKAVLFIAIQLVIGCLLVLNYQGQPKLGYMAAFEDKVELLKDQSQPRIILLGGSNVAFGVDSPTIEKALQMRVVNAGLHGALGLDLYLAVAEEYARSGDTVVLMPEWAMLSGSFKPNQVQLQQLLRESPTAWRFFMDSDYFQPKDFLDRFALPELAFRIQKGAKIQTERRVQKQIAHAEKPGIYSRLNFNQNGDFVGHYSLGTVKKIEQLPCNVAFYQGMCFQATRKINRLAQSLRKRNVDVYVAYPPFPEPFSKQFEQDIQNSHSYMTKHLSVPLLHEPHLSSFPTNHFYDSVYHLNEQGIKERTQLLVRSLRARRQIAMGSNNPLK